MRICYNSNTMNSSTPFSDEEYGKILDHLVVACVDTVVTHKGKVLLVKRDQEPAKNAWWIFGGRVIKGESLQGAAQRGIHRELNVRIHDEERFTEIGVFNLLWPTRREPLSTNGCHHILIAHHLELTDGERAKISHATKDPNRYCWRELLHYSAPDLIPELAAVLRRLRPVPSLSQTPRAVRGGLSK